MKVENVLQTIGNTPHIRVARLFPDAFYIEIQRAGHPGTESYIRHAVELAGRLGLPVVAGATTVALVGSGSQGGSVTTGAVDPGSSGRPQGRADQRV